MTTFYKGDISRDEACAHCGRLWDMHYENRQCLRVQEVAVLPALGWHDVGCAKRYGAESDLLCECEKRRAEVN